MCLLTGRGKRLCLSGGRDRTVTLWDLDKMSREENPKGNCQASIKSITAHKVSDCTGWTDRQTDRQF